MPSDLGRNENKVGSKNKDYFLNVTPKRVDDRHFSRRSPDGFRLEAVTYTDENTGTRIYSFQNHSQSFQNQLFSVTIRLWLSEGTTFKVQKVF